MDKHLSFSSYFLVGFILFLFSCNDPGVIVSINPNDYTIEQQIKIGEALREEIEKDGINFNILNDSLYKEAYSYVNTLMQTLVNTPAVENRVELNWEVNIIGNDSIRTAFMLPGGYFYVYSGLLKFLESEHQLLGLIGHEIYYADTDLMVQRLKAEFDGVLLGDIILDKEVEELDIMAKSLPFLAFTSSEITAADQYSNDLICPFQYEPLGVKEILELAANSQELEVQWLGKQPQELDINIRIQNVNAIAQGCGLGGVTNQNNYIFFKENFLP